MTFIPDWNVHVYILKVKRYWQLSKSGLIINRKKVCKIVIFFNTLATTWRRRYWLYGGVGPRFIYKIPPFSVLVVSEEVGRESRRYPRNGSPCSVPPGGLGPVGCPVSPDCARCLQGKELSQNSAFQSWSNTSMCKWMRGILVFNVDLICSNFKSEANCLS